MSGAKQLSYRQIDSKDNTNLTQEKRLNESALLLYDCTLDNIQCETKEDN